MQFPSIMRSDMLDLSCARDFFRSIYRCDESKSVTSLGRLLSHIPHMPSGKPVFIFSYLFLQKKWLEKANQSSQKEKHEKVQKMNKGFS